VFHFKFIFVHRGSPYSYKGGGIGIGTEKIKFVHQVNHKGGVYYQFVTVILHTRVSFYALNID
jgi:hypothetical protein